MKPIIPIEGNYTNGNQLHEPSLQAITARKREDDDKELKAENSYPLELVVID